MHRIIEQQFTVSFSYPVVFTRNVLVGDDGTLARVVSGNLPKPCRVLTFVDSGVSSARPELACQIEEYARLHADSMQLVVSPVIITGGERCKNDLSVNAMIHESICHHHLCRQSVVLAIGGGALLDAVGYATATAHRGLRLVRMPTTVLAQNDAGVGVKNGINAFGRKNFLGTFAPPFAVINDFSFLDSLPARDLRAGIVEAVKVALIKDEVFFRFLCQERHRLAAFVPSVMEKMICRCAELHLNHIAAEGDPFEFGSARPLDFGHWAAHKLEELSSGSLNHGEAVAIGIALDVLYSGECGMISQAAVDMVFTLLKDLGLTLYHPALEAMSVSRALEEFREHLGGGLTITLLVGLGRKKEVHAIDTARMHLCLDLLAGRQSVCPSRGQRTIPRQTAVAAAI